ncbi:PGF-CTERM sorting domain-containing protein [Halobaculum lipolyticum]|nr:PGF-CTERM sorting domain-containing protein [Halobaculum sp. DT31]
MHDVSVRVAAALLAAVCVASAASVGVAAVASPSASPVAGTGSGSLPGAGTDAATHSFVQFNVSEVRTDPGGAVAARVTFHNAYGTLLSVTGPDGFRYEAEVSPAGGVQTVLRFDTAAAGRGDTGALTAVDGEVSNASVAGAPGEPLPAGTYNVTLYAGGQLRDAMPLRIGDAAGTPPPATAARPTSTPGAAADDAGTGGSSAAAPGFGVVAAVASLAAVATALARRRRGRR